MDDRQRLLACRTAEEWLAWIGRKRIWSSGCLFCEAYKINEVQKDCLTCCPDTEGRKYDESKPGTRCCQGRSGEEMIEAAWDRLRRAGIV